MKTWALAFLLCLGSQNVKGPRPPLLSHYGFGLNAFAHVKDWPEKVHATSGVRWDFLYIYIVGPQWEEGWLNAFLDRCKRLGAIPFVTDYHLLHDGRKKGYGGPEPEVVFRALKDKDLMRAYLESAKRLFAALARHPGPVVYHSEPDSWSFVQWLATSDTHDGARCPAMVKSSGLAELAGFDDTVAGLARALLHLRDRAAPRNVYLGLSAQDFRVGTAPEKTVNYVRSLGGEKWDLLVEGTIGHIYTKPGPGFWDSLDDDAYERYLTWLSTVSRGTGLSFVQWQIPLGLGDYTLIPKYPERERVSAFARAGSIACLFEIGTDPYQGGVWSLHKGVNETPGGGTPAELLRDRLALYGRKPLKLPKRH